MGALDDLAKIIVAQNAEANQRIQAEDPYLSFKQAPDLATSLALGYATKEPGKFKTRDLITSALLSGLGSGISEGLSQDYQGRAKDAYTQAFLGSANGQPVERPQVLSPGLFRNANEQGNLFKVQNILGQAQRQQDIQDLATKAYNESFAKNAGENDYYGFTPAGAPPAVAPGQAAAPAAVDLTTLNPNSPQYKAAKEIQDRADAAGENARNYLKTTQLATNFADVKTNFDALTKYAYQKGGPAKLAAISSFARILDPNSVVREGEIRNVENTQSFLSALGTNIENLLGNKNDLPLSIKRAMLSAAADKYNSYGQDYQDLVTQTQATAGRRGVSPADVYGPVKYSPFDLAAWDKEHPEASQDMPVEPTAPQVPSAMKASDLLANGYVKTPRGWQRR